MASDILHCPLGQTISKLFQDVVIVCFHPNQMQCYTQLDDTTNLYENSPHLAPDRLVHRVVVATNLFKRLKRFLTPSRLRAAATTTELIRALTASSIFTLGMPTSSMVFFLVITASTASSSSLPNCSYHSTSRASTSLTKPFQYCLLPVRMIQLSRAVSESVVSISLTNV